MNKSILAVVLFCVASNIVGQEQESPASPEQKEPMERRWEALKNADMFLLKLALPYELEGEDNKGGVQFKAGQKVYFRLIIQNNSPEQVIINRNDMRSELRPMLYKDGELIPFKKEVDELINERDKIPRVFGLKPSRLQPSQTTEDRIELADWYAELEPGVYQLSVRRRFVFGGKWVESPSVTFEFTR